MFHMSHVTCHVSHVKYHMSRVTCHIFIPIYIYIYLIEVEELVGGGFVSTGPTPSSLYAPSMFPNWVIRHLAKLCHSSFKLYSRHNTKVLKEQAFLSCHILNNYFVSFHMLRKRPWTHGRYNHNDKLIKTIIEL